MQGLVAWWSLLRCCSSDGHCVDVGAGKSGLRSMMGDIAVAVQLAIRVVLIYFEVTLCLPLVLVTWYRHLLQGPLHALHLHVCRTLPLQDSLQCVSEPLVLFLRLTKLDLHNPLV